MPLKRCKVHQNAAQHDTYSRTATHYSLAGPSIYSNHCSREYQPIADGIIGRSRSLNTIYRTRDALRINERRGHARPLFRLTHLSFALHSGCITDNFMTERLKDARATSRRSVACRFPDSAEIRRILVSPDRRRPIGVAIPD